MTRLAHTVAGHVLARIPSPPDARDRAFLMAPAAPVPATAERTWSFGHTPFDQGDAPQCVAFAWMAELLAAPHVAAPRPSPRAWAATLYQDAQRIDGIRGAHDGTTVRAAAATLKARGTLSSYVWGTHAEQVAAHLYTRGPVVLGTNWYQGMSEAIGRGATMHGTGANEGGHAYLAIGVSMPRRAVRILNSWGTAWGDRGRAWMPFALLDRLLSEDGEACSALEVG